MAPSWLPQNIQKRIFRYILARLEVFSDLDLKNLDVSVGTKTNLTLREVQLDTDKFTLPNGVFVRSGKLGTLNLSIGVGNGVEIDGTDVEFTVALSSSSLDEDDLTDLLSRTTADLAVSLLDDNTREKQHGSSAKDSKKSQDTSDSDSDDSGTGVTGYGFGELPNMVTKVADTALSQLSIMLHGIKLRLIIDEDCSLEIHVSKVQLSTGKDGLRTIRVSEIEILTPKIKDTVENNDDDDILNHETDTERGGEDSFHMDEMQNSLMQSTLFSHEEASTMYMSAMSSMLQSKEQEAQLDRLLWCDFSELSFKGLLRSDFSLNIGTVNISTVPVSHVLSTIVNFVLKFESNTTKAKEDASNGLTHNDHDNGNLIASNEVTDNSQATQFTLKAGVKAVHISMSSLLPDGLFESEESLTFEVSSINLNIDNKQQLLTVSNIILRQGNEPVVWFAKKTGDEDEDLVCHLGNKVTVLLPHPASFYFDTDTIVNISEAIKLFSDLQISQPSQSPSSSLSSLRPKDGKNVTAKFNTIEGQINTGSTTVRATIFPSNFENGKLLIDTVRFSIKHNDSTYKAGSIEVQDISIVFGGQSLALSTAIFSPDLEQIQAPVNTQLHVSTVMIGISQPVLDTLISDLKSIHSLVGSALESRSVAQLRQVRIQESELVKFSVVIAKVEVDYSFQSGEESCVIYTDLGQIELNVLESASTQISIYTVFVTHDFKIKDSSSSYVALLYKANPSEKVCLYVTIARHQRH
ncbi:Atg2p [Sugiyamaella lignohabitans]|uniref:Atg2p n=1 Tax=Sugiyamaella lignohabitans TaxID=796027 RepID=A0A167F0U4_9ASCO|nr:Atg2p [Sugiyamaella lignohabitans]ANB14683.1 Atg2p [Sugiyamaella lignohabitans]